MKTWEDTKNEYVEMFTQSLRENNADFASMIKALGPQFANVKASGSVADRKKERDELFGKREETREKQRKDAKKRGDKWPEGEGFTNPYDGPDGPRQIDRPGHRSNCD